MAAAFNRRLRVYGGMATVVPKMFMAYSIWVWMDIFVSMIAVVILVAFWRAVFASTATLGGLTLDQTLNYLLLALLFGDAAYVSNIIYDIGAGLREGRSPRRCCGRWIIRRPCTCRISPNWLSI